MSKGICACFVPGLLVVLSVISATWPSLAWQVAPLGAEVDKLFARWGADVVIEAELRLLRKQCDHHCRELLGERADIKG